MYAFFHFVHGAYSVHFAACSLTTNLHSTILNTPHPAAELLERTLSSCEIPLHLERGAIYNDISHHVVLGVTIRKWEVEWKIQ
jgi:hypothetical protein